MLEVHLSHLQYVTRIGQENVAAFAVLGHVLVFTFLEGIQFGRIVAFNPAGFVQTDGLPTALGIVFVLQTVLDHLELQLSYRTDNLAAVELIDKQLCHTFVHQLVDTLGQLFLLHGVSILDVEAGQTAEVEQFAFGQRITNLKGSVIGQTDDITCPSLVDGRFTLCHKLCRTGKTHCLAMTHVIVRSVADKLG